MSLTHFPFKRPAVTLYSPHSGTTSNHEVRPLCYHSPLTRTATSQTVNLWCCGSSADEPGDRDGDGNGGDATIVNLFQQEEESGGGGGGEEEGDGGDNGGECGRLVASVCTHLLCPAYVSISHKRVWFLFFLLVYSLAIAPSCRLAYRCVFFLCTCLLLPFGSPAVRAELLRVPACSPG